MMKLTPIALISGARRVFPRSGRYATISITALSTPQVSIESVLAADPQVIVAGTDDARPPPWLHAWTRWPALAAVRHHNLYTVDANLLHRAGPRFADGLAQLCHVLANARGALGSDAYNRSAPQRVHG